MRILIICVGLMTAWEASGRTEKPPPFPPLGWEAEITEGFDPPIEVVLVDEYEADLPARWAHVQAWGPGAAGVLQRLYASTLWKEYQWSIRWYLELLDAPVPLEPLDERLREALAEVLYEHSTIDLGIFGFLAAYEFARRTERSAENIAVIRDAARQNSVLSAEIILGVRGDRALGAIIRAVSEIGAPEGIVLLEHMVDAMKPEHMRSSIEFALRQARDSARSLEPIAAVLERETAP